MRTSAKVAVVVSGGGAEASPNQQITIDLGHTPPASSKDVATSFDAAGAQGTPGADVGDASSSTSKTYPYPGGFGAGGTLTTNTEVPTRSIDPSRVSVVPTASTTNNPPPTDHHPTLNGTPGVPVEDDDGANPNGGMPPGWQPTESSTNRHNSITIDLNHTELSASSPTSSPNPASSLPLTSMSMTFGSASTPPPYANGTGVGWNATGIRTSIFPTSTFPANASLTSNESVTMTTDENGSTLPVCGTALAGRARTVYSIIYTETLTWYGNPADYTAPYAEITTPAVCMPMKSPFRFTYSYCMSTGTGTMYVTCETTTSTIFPTTVAFGHETLTPTVVFLTTDKNPAVVYTSIKTPGYGLSHPGTRAQISHTAVDGGGGPISTPGYIPPNSQAVSEPEKTPRPSPVTVAVQPTAVVINGQTFTDDPVKKTQTVVVGGVTFVINPSQVLGGGGVIDRPTVTGGVFVPTPTSTNIAGLPVTVSSSVAVIDGTTLTIGPKPSTTVIRGQTVSIGPGGVAIASRTIPVSVFPSPTEVVIAGGNLITAIGRSVVVIHGTTITYGPTGPSLTVIGGDTITIGPLGVVVHGTTIGGPDADPSETQYEIVGGATITQIGPSVVVIGDNTYTVGPGSGSRTTVFGGETITIGPDGVAVSTYSIAYPFGPTTTITPGATGAMSTAKPTSSKDAGLALRPDWTWVSFLSCIAIGVMGF